MEVLGSAIYYLSSTRLKQDLSVDNNLLLSTQGKANSSEEEKTQDASKLGKKEGKDKEGAPILLYKSGLSDSGISYFI